MKAKKNEKIEAIKLRKQGMAITEIAQLVGVHKASVSIWVRHLPATKKMRKEFDKRCSHPHTEETKVILSKCSKKRWSDGLVNIRHLGNLVHRKNELSAKPHIEKGLFIDNLFPEIINDIVFDFCNDKYIIEYTTDNTSGISNAIRRFEKIKNEKRIKILISPDKWFGKERRARLKNCNVIFKPIWF